jgi:hypothetical protein
MADPYLQLYSQNWFATDGSTTIWNFTFEDGYISKDYVKAYVLVGDIRTDLTITGGNFSGQYQLTITPAIPTGQTLVVYRDTPKTAPLVNYSTGARFTEANLDESNTQAIHCIQELIDSTGQLDFSDLGYKALKQDPYTGESVVQSADNGKSHFKTDGTAVTVPNTLAVNFLTSITNHSADVMNVGFDSSVAYVQGAGSDTPVVTLQLDPHSILSLTKVVDGVFYVSGPVTA